MVRCQLLYRASNINRQPCWFSKEGFNSTICNFVTIQDNVTVRYEYANGNISISPSFLPQLRYLYSFAELFDTNYRKQSRVATRNYGIDGSQLMSPYWILPKFISLTWTSLSYLYLSGISKEFTATQTSADTIVIGSTTFTLTDDALQCLDDLNRERQQKVVRNPGVFMKNCIKEQETTTAGLWG